MTDDDEIDDRGRRRPTEEERGYADAAIAETIAGMAQRIGEMPSSARPREDLEEPLPTAKTLEEQLQAGLERVRREDEERRALPCIRAIYPSGAPDGYLSASREHGELVVAVKACNEAGAEKTCPHSTSRMICAQRQHEELVERTRLFLRGAGVEEHEHKLVMAAAKGQRPLDDTDAIRAVRAFLRRNKCEVPLDSGAEIDPLTKKPTPRRLRLTGSERLLVLGGAPGRGKTLAAAYAIGRVGGHYITEYVLARPREADITALKRSPGLLVVDQVGRAVLDDRRTSALALEELVDGRYAARIDTILVPNMPFADFAVRYGPVMLDRIAGHGVYVDLSGPSLRPSTKGNR